MADVFERDGLTRDESLWLAGHITGMDKVSAALHCGEAPPDGLRPSDACKCVDCLHVDYLLGKLPRRVAKEAVRRRAWPPSKWSKEE